MITSLAAANTLSALASVGYVASGAVPDAPTNFAGTTDYNIVHFTWTAPSGTVTEYYLQRSAAGAGVWSTIQTITAPATSYDLTVTAQDTQYDYRLLAHNTYGDSSASGTVTKYTPYVYDTFTGAAATLLSAHTANIGAAWTKYDITAGTLVWQLDGSGTAYTVVGTGGAKSYVQTSLADGTVRAVMRKIDTTDGGFMGVAFRQQDASNLLLVVLDLASDTMTIRRRIAGVNTTMATASGLGLTYGVDYDLKVIFSGSGSNNMTATLDGANAITASYASLATQTRCGVLNFSSTANLACKHIVITREAA